MNPELAQYEAIGKLLLQQCLVPNMDPEELHKWLLDAIAHIGGGDDSAAMFWEDSFDYTDKMMDEFDHLAQMPESEKKTLSWPWQSWRDKIDPLDPGMLAMLTAPDGQGKTIYAESIAEYWAAHKNKVVFVHYELNRKLMMLRRLARYTGIQVRELKSGHLTPEQRETVRSVRPRLSQWDGNITYLHTPGWTMERTIAELRKLHAEGLCDVVVLDYLEKAQVSSRQINMFGNNTFPREADNVEQLKIFGENTEVPVQIVAQMNKSGKKAQADVMDRSDIRGAGEKSDKANLVVLLKREKVGENYSNEVDVMIDKNTMGPTGGFKQIMQPEYFRVGDIARL